MQKHGSASSSEVYLWGCGGEPGGSPVRAIRGSIVLPCVSDSSELLGRFDRRSEKRLFPAKFEKMEITGTSTTYFADDDCSVAQIMLADGTLTEMPYEEAMKGLEAHRPKPTESINARSAPAASSRSLAAEAPRQGTCWHPLPVTTLRYQDNLPSFPEFPPKVLSVNHPPPHTSSSNPHTCSPRTIPIPHNIPSKGAGGR